MWIICRFFLEPFPYPNIDWLSRNKPMKYEEEEKSAYGRQSISRPLRIVAQRPKNSSSKAKFAVYEQSFQLWGDFFPLLFPQRFWKSKKFGNWTSESGGTKTFKRIEQLKKKNLKKKKKNFFCSGNFTPCMSKSFQIWDHFFLLLFPKDSENLKSLHIGLWKMGAKIPLKGVRNTNTKTILLSKEKLPKNKLFFARQFYTLY